MTSRPSNPMNTHSSPRSLRAHSLTVSTLAITFAAGLSLTAAHAQVVVQDNFDYPAGSALSGQNGGTGFSNAYFPAFTFNGGDSANGSSIATGSLADPSGLLTATANSATFATNADGNGQGFFREVQRNFDPTLGLGTTGTTTYLSFLIRPEVGPGAGIGGAFIGLEFGNLSAGRLFIGTSDGAAYNLSGFGANSGGTVNSTTAPVEGQAALLVLRADFLDGADTLTLFVNPTPGGAEPAAGFVKSDLDLGAVNGLGFSITKNTTFDEIRLGNTFADVTATVPEPSTWALTLGALGSLLLARRVRRQRVA